MNKGPCNEKQKLPKKNKKLNPFPKNRTPSAKTLKKNSIDNIFNNKIQKDNKSNSSKKSISKIIRRMRKNT